MVESQLKENQLRCSKYVKYCYYLLLLCVNLNVTTRYLWNGLPHTVTSAPHSVTK